MKLRIPAVTVLNSANARAIFFLALAASLLAGRSAFAANYTWVGNTSGNFDTAGNWNPNTSVPPNSSTLTFGAAGSSGASLNNNIPASPGTNAYAGIVFSAAAGAYTFSGNVLDLLGPITDNANAGTTETINFNLGLVGSPVTLSVAPGNNLTLGGVLSGAGGISVSAGGGTLTLVTANTYNGGTTLSGGTLVPGQPGALGNDTNSTLSLNGGTLDLAINSSINPYNATVGASTTVVSDNANSGAGVNHTLGTLGMGAFTLTATTSSKATNGVGGVTFGNTTLNGLAVFDAETHTVLTIGALQNNGSMTVASLDGTGVVSFNAAAAGGATNSVLVEDATLVAAASSPFGPATGTTLTINGGTLDLAINSSISPYNTAIGFTNVTVLSDRATPFAGITHTLGTLSISNQVLLTVSGGPQATNGTAGLVFGPVQLYSNAMINVTNSAYGAAVRLSLGPIADGGNANSLVKLGDGALVLSGANSYSGATIVSNGTVLVDGSLASGTLTVVSGTLGGTGFVNGPVTMANGTTLTPGGPLGTLTISNNLALNGVALDYALGTNSALTAVTGNLTATGTVNIANSGGFTNGTYTLFTYGGALTYNGLTVGSTPGGYLNYAISTSTVGQVNLIVTIGISPVIASFSAYPTNGTLSLPVAFTDSSSGPITNWFWNFGDGNTTNFTVDTNPMHTYSPGSYSPSLTVSGTGGTNTGSICCINVASTNLLYAAFRANTTNGLAPLNVNFTDGSSGPITNRFWSFGDGGSLNSSMQTNPAHSYTIGTYSVSLTVRGATGTNTSMLVNYIQAQSPPGQQITPGSLNFGSVTVGQTNTLSFSIINNGQATLTGTITSAAPFLVTSSYNVGGGQTDAVGVAFVPNAPGTFNGSVIFSSSTGVSTNTVTGVGLTPGGIMVMPATLAFGAVATGAQVQASFVVTNSGSTAVTNGTAAVTGGPFTIVSGAVFSVPALGTTNVAVQFAPVTADAFTDAVVFATANGGNASNAVTGTGAVAPEASFDANSSTGTEPLVVTFRDSSTGTQPITLYWNLGDSVLVTNTGGANFNHTYPAGAYTVALTASNAFGANTLITTDMITVVTALQAWQQAYFGCTNCAPSQPDADPLGKGMSNTNQFLVGFNPTNSAAYLRVISIASPNSTDINVIYLGPNGDSTWSPGIASRTNILEFTAGAPGGGYSNNFVTANLTNILSGGTGNGLVTNFVDVGGATNTPSRYYRVRVLLP